MSSLDDVDEDVHLRNVNGVKKCGGPDNYKIFFKNFIQENKIHQCELCHFAHYIALYLLNQRHFSDITLHNSTVIQKEKADQIHSNKSIYDFARFPYTKMFFNRLNLCDGYSLTLPHHRCRLHTEYDGVTNNGY